MTHWCISCGIMLMDDYPYRNICEECINFKTEADSYPFEEEEK